jgi:flagellar biosynthesis/type III secretory pathway protein FliH
MKMKKYVVILIAASFLGTGCKKKYEEGFNAGKQDGIVQGRLDGSDEGYSNGFSDGVQQSYDTAFTQGHADGLVTGYSEGSDYFLTAGFEEGHSDGQYDGQIAGDQAGYAVGYNTAYDSFYSSSYINGEDDGYDDGYSDGRSDGYDDGYSDGSDDSYYDGYDDGFDDGYDDGYYDGYDDGYYDSSDQGRANGSAIKSNNPSVKIAAMVNSDLIDYSKLKRFNSRPYLSIGLNHADNGTLDMEKLSALKEKHYLTQMSHQIQVRFGLSSDRSYNIAKAANQFNKLSGTRELTDKDAELFATNVIGIDIKSIENALAKSMKGDSKLLNELLKSVAVHNETSPEKVNQIITEIFF